MSLDEIRKFFMCSSTFCTMVLLFCKLGRSYVWVLHEVGVTYILS
jgi:hypothetical protein